MIPYQDWIARGPAVCDAECEELMCINAERKLCGDVALGRAFDNCLEGAGDECDCTHLAGGGTWVTCSLKKGARPINYTTDRNATALLLDEVVRQGESCQCRFNLVLRQEIDRSQTTSLLARENATASLLAYCAWRALKEEAV